MKIATTLFLLVVLVLGAFFVVGNLVEVNRNLRDQVSALQQQIDQLNQKIADLTSQLKQVNDHNTSLQKELDDKLTQAKELKNTLAGIQNELKDTRSQLKDAEARLAQTLTQLQQAPSLANLIPGGLGLPLVIGYGVMLAGVSLLGYKGYLTPRHAHPTRPAQPTVKLTMSERTYHEFQQYLKKGGK